ncbi:MAG: sugar-binding protein [Clostridiales bacterium]|nr:sugar-binding protein [Clostridiales bacterium]
MKKILSVLLLLALVMSMFAGCAAKVEAPVEEDVVIEEPAAETLVVGVSLPTQREERWVRDKVAMEAYAAEMGIELKVQVADADQAQQAQQVENLLTQGIDVLILAPHDASASAELIKKANAEGVKVISYDRLVTGTHLLDYYLSFDNEKVGALQGNYFVENAQPGNIMLFAGAPTDNNASLFFAGAMSVIQPKIDDGTYTVLGGSDFTQVATDNWVPANAQNRASNILTANPDATISGVLAPNDGTAGGIIEAFKAAKVVLPVITGQDSEIAAIKRIKGGDQSMTIFKDTRELAKAAIDMAISIYAGETVATNGLVDNGVFEVPSVLLEPKVVTQGNFQEMLINSGYIQESDLN